MRSHEKLVVIIVGCLIAFGRVANKSAVLATPQAQSSSAGQSPASRLGVFPYPKNQQGAEQQKKDANECYGWAKQQTGVDPASPPPPPAEAAKVRGGALKGAAGEAAGGAAIGAAAGDAGKGAAIGATAGAVRARRQQRMANKQAEKQTEVAARQKQQQALDVFRKAFSSCMDGRGYSVK